MLTRKEFLWVGAGTLAATLLTPGKAKGALVSKHWLMSYETWEKSVGRRADLAEAMRGSTGYVGDSDVGELAPKPYGLRVIENHIFRRFETIDKLIAEGELTQGTSATWAIENGGRGDDVDPSDQTPIEQQMHLPHYLRAARDKCHRVGAKFIAAPAGNILDNLDPGSTDRLESFLRLGIPGMCSRYADGYDIQVQQMEQNAVAYEEFVRACTTQARGTDPTTIIFAGLTTSSRRSAPDDYPTASEIAAAAKSVRDAVDGYWLNVPAHRDTGVKNYPKARRAMCLFYDLPVL